MQVAGETFEIIQSDVLQGSKVILDVEEEGLNERTILSLDAATKISSSGMTCFRSSDGKEHCFVDAQPGQCDSFGGPERLLLEISPVSKKDISVTVGNEPYSPSKKARIMVTAAE
jgi:hypothetical protein